MTSCLVLVILSLGQAMVQAAVYVAPDDRPTADEVAIVVHLNRFRADPAAEAKRILADGELPGFFWRGVDKAMFEREMSAIAKAPPVVFDLDALRAARRHSYYMIHNGLGHDESPAKEGFTGGGFVERMKAAGFTGFAGGENCFATAGNAWQSHVGFLIDFGPGGPGGMQAGRGHRANMANPQATVLGPGAVPHEGKLSVTHDFGRGQKRAVGGVIYVDRNANGSFDPGEGRGDVLVRSGTNSVRSWPSGGFVLGIEGGKGTVGASYGELQSGTAYAAGADHVWFTWAIPAEEDLAICDRLITEVEQVEPDQRVEGRGLRAVVALYQRCEELELDEPRRKRVEDLSRDTAARIQADRTVVLAALDGAEAGALKESLATAAKTWRGTEAAAWFTTAEQLGKATAGVVAFEAARAKGVAQDAKRTGQLREALRQAQENAPTELAARYAQLLARILD